MANRAQVTVLKQQLEQLFPGKWLTGGDADRLLRTGIEEIDAGMARGFHRRRISEWRGAASSGKSTLLRAMVAHWCLVGLNVAYIDSFSRLSASDWAFVDQGLAGAAVPGMVGIEKGRRGHFFVIRVSERLEALSSPDEPPGPPAGKSIKKEACWAAEQLLRCNVFDVVIFDLGASMHLHDRIYARLQRTLERSRSALIIVRDTGDYPGHSTASGWGCHTRADLRWSGHMHTVRGLSGSVSFLPSIGGAICRDGLSQNIEVKFNTHVSNRLFTHPSVPDRRTAKA